jgi:two-component system osmolarity sensor histidine kinase EnvZ
MNPQRPALTLFWRTFFYLLVLLVGSLGALALVWSAKGPASRDAQAGRELAALVSLSRAALQSSDRNERTALLRQLAQAESLRLQPRMPEDKVAALPDERTNRLLAETLRTRFGPGTVLAGQVNDVPAVWVGFAVERENWWLAIDPGRARPSAADIWPWALLVLVGALLGSALIAHQINKPLRELSFAASRIRGGDLDSRLDESTITSEIREVNMGFNRMARELAKVDEDRAVMLAGISHDLRTPLARLRLEAEMSVADEEARGNIVSDINQLDAIIDKFMDYARPGETNLKPVLLSNLIDKEAAAFRDPTEIRIANRVAIDLKVMADEVELGRVLANLFENARRYGRSADTGRTLVEVSYVRIGGWVICSVRDHGPGFAADKLDQLTTPFFRGDAARTAATGAGLGLAIVEKAMSRMKGTVELANAPEGGLIVHLRLRHGR